MGVWRVRVSGCVGGESECVCVCVWGGGGVRVSGCVEGESECVCGEKGGMSVWVGVQV